MTVLRLRTCPFCELTHATYDGWIVCRASRVAKTPDGVEHRRLSPAVLETLTTLLARRGRYTGAESVATALWGNEWEWPEFYRGVVATYVKTLRDLGVATIRNHPGRGWEIVC